MAGLRGALAAAVIASGVLLGTAACGGSSTVTSSTTAVDGDGASSGPTSLPATAAGPPSVAADPKDKAFVAKMRTAGLVASDESILGAVQYTCAALKTNSNPSYQKTLETLVKGMIGASRTGNGVSAQEADKLASSDANKLIAEAKASYCEK